ncbi:S9 family peptidase [Kineosporia succinea]|uniref:Dipeptidyl aminopeptidase/acylaminoacyl peptidase n=1 Tax=Kineosporia succinea TaxID=84632 RepID=A0ABT9P185_9ACTN|nr:S9 family peptidase [Kineosporia succinea]MDP9826451.1 dipeptidyl aminopeptidase/acylaminoacyl peptidase [Kineosporia succinea]
MNSPERGFGDLDHYLELPRLSGLALSPDGQRLITAVSVLGAQRTTFVSSLWEISADPEGPEATRLTWGSDSESGARFRPDGDLLFVSSRPDPDDDEEERPPSLWLLPARGGEARPFVTRPGGVSSAVVAADAGTVVLTSPTLPSSTTTGDDERRRKARKESKVVATLHESAPFRWWDDFWGPETDRLYAVTGEGSTRDLTGHTGPALRPGPDYAVTPDGTTVIASWQKHTTGGQLRPTLVAIDVATGERRTLLDTPGTEFINPVISADGTKVALIAEQTPTPDEPGHLRLVVLHLATGETREASPGWDRWPSGSVVWTPDGEALLVAADDQGHSPVFRFDLDDRSVRRLTSSGAFTDLAISRDGAALFALHSTVGSPPAPVRIDPQTGEVTPLRGPAAPLTLPGTVTEIETMVVPPDLRPGEVPPASVTVRGWLVLPEGAGPENPAPLLLWIHGGPAGSWNAWSWRWNPWLAAARGYAVLLPDPALSTGYGQDWFRRGWSGWGGAPYTDLIAITDAIEARPDIDADRTAAMGASFGGYMANWIAGHTDRFRGIVSHAGIWDLETFRLTTDAGFFWRQVMSSPNRAANTASAHAEKISTPMLITHGDKDYRAPVSESLALFARLAELNVDAEGTMAHRLLVFPDENHWILKPQNARLWYSTVFAFLAHTVLDEPWQAPDLLR